MNLATSNEIFRSWDTFSKKIAEDENTSSDIYRSSVCMSNSLTSTNFFTRTECCCGCATLKTLMSSYFLDESREIKVTSGVKKGTLLKMFSRDNIDTRVENGVTRNPFMNYVMVSCVLKKILKMKSYPVKIPYEWCYICKDKFNIVLDVTGVSSIKDISRLDKLTNSSPLARKTIYNPISKSTTNTIFEQIVLLCHFYGMYAFCHGEPSITYIALNPITTRFKYNDHQIDSSVRVSISPSMYSSVTYNRTRFALNNQDLDYSRTYENKDIGIEGDHYTGNYEDHRIVYVKIGNKSEQFLKNMINGKCEIKSFDFVMFMSSLVANKQFMTSFGNCPYVYIWKNIWREEDYSSLSTDLSNIRTNSFSNVFNVIKGYYFRVDALKYAMSMI